MAHVLLLPLPRLTLDEFCLAYGLSDDINTKLAAKKVTGPHSLEFINDDVLLNAVGLEIGELGDLQHAVQSWKYQANRN